MNTEDSVKLTAPDVHGVVVIDKPDGITSHDAVNRVRRLFGTRRVGHTGTLDPMATGVLVVCVGQATRIAEYLAGERKEYEAGVTFGLETESQDSTGRPIREADAAHLSRESIEGILPRFRGGIQQIPPMVSAVHHEGKRLYELARQGLEVERAARPVQIHRLELKEFEPGPHPRAILEVECSAGTYIRTLAADLGAALGAGGTMHSLRRTRSGVFTLADSFTLEELEERKSRNVLRDVLKSIARALADWPTVTLTPEEAACILHGQAIMRPIREAAPHLMLSETGKAMAIAEVRQDGMLAPTKVFLAS